jgi:hypothetical protein
MSNNILDEKLQSKQKEFDISIPTWYQVISNYWRYNKNLNLTEDLKSGKVVANILLYKQESTSTFADTLRKIVDLYNNNDVVHWFIQRLHESIEKQTMPSLFDYRCTKIMLNKNKKKSVHLLRFIKHRDPKILYTLFYDEFIFEYYELSEPNPFSEENTSEDKEIVLPTNFNYDKFLGKH